MSCRRHQDHMADQLYGRLSAADRAEFEDHLAGCGECAREFRELRETIALATREKPRIDTESRLRDFWPKLEPALDQVDRERRRRRGWVRPAWAALAAAAALALLFTPALRWDGPNRTKPEDPASAVDARMTAYLDRVEPFLLSLVNVTIAEDDEQLDETIADERARAARLADEATALQTTLAHTAPLSQRHLLGDIELLLLQVANLRESEYRHGLEMVRAFMERRIILFKLSLLESQSKPLHQS